MKKRWLVRDEGPFGRDQVTVETRKEADEIFDRWNARRKEKHPSTAVVLCDLKSRAQDPFVRHSDRE